MKRYIKTDTETKYLYHQLNNDAKEFAILLFKRWMMKENNIQLSDNDADQILADSNTAFDSKGFTVDSDGDFKMDAFILPNNWKDYLTDDFSGKVDKRHWFDQALQNGTIYYDEHFGGYIYEYSEMGFTDEIFIGKTEEEAFKEFCEINW